MTYSILDAQVSDVGEISATFIDAFKEDPMVGQLWPDVSYEENYKYHIRQFEPSFTKAERDGIRFRKLIDDETGRVLYKCMTQVEEQNSEASPIRKLIAFAKWVYPHTLSAEQTAEKEKEESNKESPPKGTNVKLQEIFFGALEKKRKYWTDGSKDYFLHLLCVAPSHQRLGLGSLLIREGLAVVDEQNARTYIEASPKGLQLYLRHGWKEVDNIVIDMKPYGKDFVASEKCLMRKPGGK